MLRIKYLSDLLAITEKSKTDITLTCFRKSTSEDAYFNVEYFTYKKDIQAIVDDKSGKIITTIANLERPTNEGRDGFNRICNYLIDSYMISGDTAYNFEKPMIDLLSQLALTTYAKEHLYKNEGLTYNLNKLVDVDRFYSIVHKKTQESIDFTSFLSDINHKLEVHIKEYLILNELGYEPDVNKLFKKDFATSM